MPQHVSVIGSNDSHTASQLGLKMTTVRQPMNEIGATAVEMLRWRMQRAAPDARPRRTLLTPEFVERATHGPLQRGRPAEGAGDAGLSARSPIIRPWHGLTGAVLP